LAVGAFLVAAAVPANAASLRRGGAPGANGSGSNGGPTGNYLFAWYDIFNGVGTNTHNETPQFAPANADDVIRYVDPNGCGNSGVSNGVCGSETDLCAMIYVFDDDQEMGECCGCRITPNELETFSVRNNLVNNWGLGTQDNGSGVIVTVGSAVNDASATGGCSVGASNNACHRGCNPAIALVTTGPTNLDGSITHDQLIAGTSGLTEIPLFDQGAGETTNNAYLVAQCGALNGNSSHTNGFCNCPTDDTP